MAKRRKPIINHARGFATISTPPKPKTSEPALDAVPTKAETKELTVTGPGKATKEKGEEEYTIPTEEEQEELELQRFLEKHGPKVQKESQRILKAGTEKRTIRNICFPLKLEKILGFNLTRSAPKQKGEIEQEVGLGEQILKLAREEYSQLHPGGGNSRRGETALVNGWVLHRVLITMGFPTKRVEEGLELLVEMRTNTLDKEKGLESAMEDVLDWLALYCDEDELPIFLETSGTSRRGGFSGSSNVTLAEKLPPSGASTPHTNLHQEADNRHLSTSSSHYIPTSNFESNDTLAKGKTFDGVEDEEGEEEEITPEQLTPHYIKLQAQIHNLHPASTAVFSGRKGGKGQKPANIPTGLSPEEVKELKKLQNKLEILTRDPLFDLRGSEFIWTEERLRLEKERWTKKQSEDKWAEKNPKPPKPKPLPSHKTAGSDGEGDKDGGVSSLPSESPPLVKEDGTDLYLIGDLFEPPPTEEATVGETTEEKVIIRDFEDSGPVGNFGKKEPKGKAGVSLAIVKSLLEEICKSRDVSSKIRYESIPGTSISSRSRLIINWSSIAAASSIKITLLYHEQPPVIVNTQSLLSTVFSMSFFGTVTKEQAEGYIATYALFQLCKKEEKIYLRLPTIWRRLWSEFVEETRLEAERQEREVLKGLRKLLGIGGSRYGIDERDTIVKKKQAANSGVDKSPGEVKDTPHSLFESIREAKVVKEMWQYKINTPEYLHMLKARQQLPIWAFKEEMLATIEQEQVVIICGETGCGKSTQTPAFILGYELSQGKPCKIYCTEPRRISAISLARRVSEELGERRSGLGGKDSLVGYSVRLESNMHAGTRLIYATTGIVVRMLERSPELKEITHLILDEVHERSIDNDFLMVALKKLLLRRKDLKVILMSATVDAGKFSKYFGGAPVMNVPGRAFPVRTHYLEDAIQVTRFKVEDDPRSPRNQNDWVDDNYVEIDIDNEAVTSTQNLAGYAPETKMALSRLNPQQIPYELIVRLLETVAFSPEYIEYSKAILVFLPGMGEIRRLNDLLSVHPEFGSNRIDGGWLIYPLHSTIANEDQEAAFLVPPKGMRKIVIATDIAETGITIPDVTCVIDSGKHNEMRFDERRQLSKLVETFVSRANAKQRSGRAGRVQEGLCFHLFTKDLHDKLMADQQPEMMRLSLQDLALRVKICKLGGIEETLAQALDAPLPKNIRRAIDSLVDVKALTVAEEPTPLGRQLAKLPLDVYLGKMVLLGNIYGCLDAVVTIAAILSSKSPFVTPMGYRKEADSTRFSFKRGDSDLLTGWNAYSSWRRVCQGNNITEADFCRMNYLSGRTLSGIEELKQQLVVAIIDAGFFSLTSEERNYFNRCRFNKYRRRNFFVVPQSVNHSSENDSVINAVVAAGFYPKLLTRDGKGWRNIVNSQPIVVHPSSVNRVTKSEWLAYYGIMKSNKFYDAHETSHVDEITIALLCGDAEFKMHSGVVILDGNRVRLAFQNWKSMVALKIFRSRLKEIMDNSFRTPGRSLSENQKKWLEIFYLMYQRVQQG